MGARWPASGSRGPTRRSRSPCFPVPAAIPALSFAGSVPTFNGGVWWSRDGRALYYTNADRMNVWRQPLSGEAATAVTGLADGMIGRGDLSSDGRSLLAVRANPLRDAFLITGFR